VRPKTFSAGISELSAAVQRKIEVAAIKLRYTIARLIPDISGATTQQVIPASTSMVTTNPHAFPWGVRNRSHQQMNFLSLFDPTENHGRSMKRKSEVPTAMPTERPCDRTAAITVWMLFTSGDFGKFDAPLW
jgi:hypothetical protein